MKKIILLTLLTAFSLNSFSQKGEKKYDKVLFKSFKIETEEYIAEIMNVVSVATEAKFKLDIKNKTVDFLVFDATKSSFKIGGNSFVPKDKFIIIEPFESKSRTISVLGKDLNTFLEYEFTLAGIQRVVMIDKEITAPVFKLPASNNDFEAGKFRAQLKNHKKESGQTYVKYDVQYKGDKIGFITPSKINVLMPDGNVYANSDTKGKTFILFPGDSEKFYASWDKMPGGRANDMQIVEMNIQFNGVFAEGKATNLESKTSTLIWDEALTTGKVK